MSPKRNPSATVETGTAATTTTAAGGLNVKVARLVAGSVPGKVIVDFDGNPHGPLAARTVVALDQRALDEAIAVRRMAVLLFENGDARLPIVVGLVAADPGASLLSALLAPASGALAPQPVTAPAAPVEARVDGKRIVVEGQEEVVLKCGEASITLKRDGKLILRGAYVETHAKGVNRIKGGSVKIN